MVRLLLEPSGGFILETTADRSIGFVLGRIIYPIPSDLGSQDDSSQASSTVGNHVQSPGSLAGASVEILLLAH